MKGRLNDPDDLEWLLAWLNSSCGEKVDFVSDDTLRELEFVTGPNEVRLSWYAYEILRSGACRVRCAQPIAGQWVGWN